MFELYMRLVIVTIYGQFHVIILPPMDWIAVSPARTIKSPQDSDGYFSLTGQSNRFDLSKLVLSGQLRSGSKRCRPPSHPPRPSDFRYDPAQCHAWRMKSGP